ncbi:hypothetical protein AMJ83_02220 [candidate division WOR_3 bacterium SM23_42]|uniref:Thioredoxin domain-containing protein n=1 Tax=candidate division WOR_3 bacterium SM23_42 TaxID=1703779 RepID=A0A0S8FXV4_UNCW3|nr:MAG: hypothetical protein AMJ83_02220 [candidate division WOR_3 bacterium SM23_42]
MRTAHKTAYYILCTILLLSLPRMGHAQDISQKDSIFIGYNIEVGKRLFYTSKGKLEYSEGTLESKERLEVMILKQNPDGSHLLLLRISSLIENIDKKGKRESLQARSDQAFCSLRSNGRFTRNWALDNLAQYDLFLPNLFPPLPEGFSEDIFTWEFTDRLFGDKDQYSAEKPNPEERSWIIHVTHHTLLDEVYLMNQKADIYFDIIKGLPIYKKDEGIRGHGRYAGTSSATVFLDSITDLDTLWAQQYARELTIFLSTDSTYNHILHQAEINPERLIPMRKDAENLLSSVNARITIPEIKTPLNNMINQLPKDFEQITEQIHKMAKYVNKPSPNWKAGDFNGQRHSLDDYRGKVILLDFWYRACPWCIRAMPMIKQVAEYFKERPVVVLGVNTDKNREDALFVIQKTNPNYVNLSGRDLTKKYGVANYPTFIIIDRNGFVRQIRIGYEPKLFDALVEMIEALL